MRFGFLTSAGFLIFIHDPSGSAARGVLKGFILAESQPIGGFHQAGIGALDDFPSVVSGRPSTCAISEAITSEYGSYPAVPASVMELPLTMKSWSST